MKYTTYNFEYPVVLFKPVVDLVSALMVCSQPMKQPAVKDNGPNVTTTQPNTYRRTRPLECRKIQNKESPTDELINVASTVINKLCPEKSHYKKQRRRGPKRQRQTIRRVRNGKRGPRWCCMGSYKANLEYQRQLQFRK